MGVCCSSCDPEPADYPLYVYFADKCDQSNFAVLDKICVDTAQQGHKAYKISQFQHKQGCKTCDEQMTDSRLYGTDQPQPCKHFKATYIFSPETVQAYARELNGSRCILTYTSSYTFISQPDSYNERTVFAPNGYYTDVITTFDIRRIANTELEFAIPLTDWKFYGFPEYQYK
jgi:hypothetical protein